MTEIVYPPWRQRLARSLHINRSQVHAKYYQVASICPAGRPKNRTMVFRGFLANSQSLLSVTDIRSEKVAQWQGKHKSHFEICWYFSGSREQYRLSGEVALLSHSLDLSYTQSVLGQQTKQSLLKQQWSDLSANARQAFYSSSPKAPFDENTILANPAKEQLTQGKKPEEIDIGSSQISDNFCVVIFIPDIVDYLNLKSKPQERCLYDIQDDWKERWVNP
jgi:pyridoxamine 5'-phosphate oxidase